MALSIAGAVVTAVVLASEHAGSHTAALAVAWVTLSGLGTLAYLARCRSAAPLERARLQWLGWGLVVGATIVVGSLGLEAIVGFPRRADLVAVAVSVLVPFSLVVGTYDATARMIERLLVRTIVVAGLVALVEAIYLLVVIGLGHVPTSSDRKVLASSMIAAAVAALFAIPARHRLEEVANQRGLRRPPRARRAAADLRRTHVARRAARRAAPAAGRVAPQEPGTLGRRGLDGHRRRARLRRLGARTANRKGSGSPATS